MNLYVVHIPETRCACNFGAAHYDPPEPYTPIDVFRAETRGQAKADALNVFIHARGSGVYDDDWKSLRCRLLARDVLGKRGVLDSDDPWQGEAWNLVHEVLDHGGLGRCDCAEEEVS